MAHITKKRRGELLRAVFEVLVDHPDGLRAKEVLKRVEDRLTLTDFEKSDYPKSPGVRRFDKIVRFCTISPVKAGWMTKGKGTWTITEDGIQALQRHDDPLALATESARLYRKWKADQPADEEPDNEEVESSTTVEEAEENAWQEIEEHLTTMNPYDFQDLVAKLLEAMDYHIAWIAPPGPDRGIDIIAHTDPLGVTGARIKVQVKRQAKRVDSAGMRSFMAVLGQTDVGIFVNTGGFTKDAAAEARHQESRRVMVIDLQRLFDLWVEHYENLEDEARGLLRLRAVYFLTPQG